MKLKTVTRLIVCLLLLLSAIGICFVDATQFAPSRLKIRYEAIASAQIPAQLDGVRILFFSDVHYNGFVDDQRFMAVIEKINAAGADVVLFGGDLFDHPANQLPTEEQWSFAQKLLSSIEAPLGKFAVLGNHDLEAASTKEQITVLLQNSGFEVITNQSIHLRNRGSQSISLVGLDSELLGSPNISEAFAEIAADDFTLVICHTPDTVLLVPEDLTDLMLAGHSHGGQVNLPLLGAMVKPDYAQAYYAGKHQIGAILLDVSNGTGTTRMDVRFLADAEIVIYQLSSISDK